MQYRFVNARINSGTNVTESCKKICELRSVTSEFKKGVCGIFAATGPQFDDRCLFGTLAFQKQIEISQF